MPSIISTAILWWCSIHSITKCPKCLSLENSFCFSKIIALNRKREDSASLVLLFLSKWWPHHVLAINWTGLHQHGWFLHWKDWCSSWNSKTLATWCEELTHLKRPWCWERLRAGGHGDDRRWDGWMASPTQWSWVWVNSSSWDGQGVLACCGSWGREESDTTEWLNWTSTWGMPGVLSLMDFQAEVVCQ